MNFRSEQLLEQAVTDASSARVKLVTAAGLRPGNRVAMARLAQDDIRSAQRDLERAYRTIDEQLCEPVGEPPGRR